MLDRFIDTASTMFTSDDKILLAVSGGVDSMVMFHLFTCTDYHFAVAHCNFSLRGEESDGDTALVERTCAERGVKLHQVTFDTHDEMDRTGESVQMAARRLRYDWFHEICDEFGYTKIAIAHNSGDTIETFFINLVRGTGVRGLTGISAVRERLVRPIMEFSREEIVNYAHAKDVAWRDDSSNSGTKYLRNKIRHIIIPQFKEIEPEFDEVMLANLSKVSDAVSFIDCVVKEIRDKAFSFYRGRITISLSIVGRYEPMDFLLYELLSPLGFNHSVVIDIVKCYKAGQESRHFESDDLSAFLSRGLLILSPKDTEVDCGIAVIDSIEKPCLYGDEQLIFEVLERQEVKSFKVDCDTVFFDFEQLSFPLVVRSWRDGDYFVPFGMEGRKKLSDYFVDSKINLLDKDNEKLLVDGSGAILWLIGRRSDNRYRVTDRTKKILKIKRK